MTSRISSGMHFVLLHLFVLLQISIILTPVAMAQDDEDPPARPAFRMGPPIVSPEIHMDDRVTFRLMAPDAREVAISGDWMDGWGAREPLVRGDSGLWTVTLGPLEPEFHGYSFVVDGLTVLDPSNPIVRRDGTRNASTFLLLGEKSELYAVDDVPHGTLAKVWYESPTLDMNRLMYVYTPPGYEDSQERYPVLYLLHGGGGDEDAWTTLGRAPQILDNLIARGEAEPMLVVMTNGNPDHSAAPGQAPERMSPTDGGIGAMGSGRFETSLINDVIPFIDARYRTLTDRAHRAVAGLSMGGIQTLNLSFDHTETFDFFGVMSMGIIDRDPSGRELFPNVDEKIAALNERGFALYWVGCGAKDFLYDACNNLHAKLDEHGVEHTYRQSAGGHTWSEWRTYLSELAPLLFR